MGDRLQQGAEPRRRRGRPPSPDSATAVLKFRIRPTELERFRKAAQHNHQSLTDFARDALNGAVEDTLEVGST